MTTPVVGGAVGKRKTAIARVRLTPGAGVVVVNGRPLEEYFPRLLHQQVILSAFRTAGVTARYNAMVKVIGGGSTGQAEAIRHGIARALCEADETLRAPLKRQGLLTRDARIKERKKYGLKRARKAPQYTKR
ncbi:MAG: 30S ribosomal protein S9 [Dehalococcoidia bacterium]|nr:30S ribosomal protein S9 [Dehalococcoidia bacterium]